MDERRDHSDWDEAVREQAAIEEASDETLEMVAEMDARSDEVDREPHQRPLHDRPALERPVSGEDLIAFQRLVRKVPVAEPVMRYALSLVRSDQPEKAQQVFTELLRAHDDALGPRWRERADELVNEALDAAPSDPAPAATDQPIIRRAAA